MSQSFFRIKVLYDEEIATDVDQFMSFLHESINVDDHIDIGKIEMYGWFGSWQTYVNDLRSLSRKYDRLFILLFIAEYSPKLYLFVNGIDQYREVDVFNPIKEFYKVTPGKLKDSLDNQLMLF